MVELYLKSNATLQCKLRSLVHDSFRHVAFFPLEPSAESKSLLRLCFNRLVADQVWTEDELQVMLFHLDLFFHVKF